MHKNFQNDLSEKLGTQVNDIILRLLFFDLIRLRQMIILFNKTSQYDNAQKLLPEFMIKNLIGFLNNNIR